MSFYRNTELLKKLEQAKKAEDSVIKNIEKFLEQYKAENEREKLLIKQLEKDNTIDKVSEFQHMSLNQIFLQKHFFFEQLTDIEETINDNFDAVVLDRHEIINKNLNNNQTD